MRRRAELVFFAATLLVTAVGAAFSLRLWAASPRVPFTYFFDSLFHAAMVKGTIDHGWYLDNPSLGAPYGLRLHDFPLGTENLHVALLKGLGALGGDWALAVNAYFLLGFLLVSAAAYVVLRQVGLSRWASLGAANLFSLLPYHFVAGQLQLFQATYFAVPLGAFLVLDTLGWDVWRRPFLARAEEGRPRAGLLRWAVRAGCAAVVASAGSSYAPFTVVLVVVAAAVALVVDGDRRALLRAAGVALLVAAVAVVNNAPTLLYRDEHGPNAQVAVRRAGESDVWALHVVDLFLPAQDHRLAPLARLRGRLDRFSAVSPIAPAPHTPLGVAGASGLAASLVAVARAVRRRRSTLADTWERLARLGLLNLACILFGTATGFSALLALAGFTQLRAWSRLSVFIGFFSLAALGLAVDALAPRLRRLLGGSREEQGRAAVLAPAAAAVAFVLLVLDQTPGSYAPDAHAEVFRRDRAFVGAIERAMPAGAAVFQLPLATFPEGLPIASMADYTHLRGYLQSRSLRWSYPAMRGRPTDWAWSLGGRPVPAFVDAVTAAGFSALWVDRSGFLDQARALERELTALVGPPLATSPHGLVVWDLRARAEAQRADLGADGVSRLRRLVLAPVVPEWESGFAPPVGRPATVVRGDFAPYPQLPGQSFVTERPARSPSVLALHNPLAEQRSVRVHLTVRTDVPDGGSLRFDVPGAPATIIGASAEPRPVELALVLPPGRTKIRVTSVASQGGGDPGAGFHVGNVVIADSGTAPGGSGGIGS